LTAPIKSPFSDGASLGENLVKGALYSVVLDFHAYAEQPDDELDLLEGALLIAKDAYPALDPAEVAADLDALAEPLVAANVASMSAPVQARALQEHLFVRAGFRGNRDDYYDPRNSFLNEVVARRVGIPISLSLVYIEVARRAGVQASPVGFPGHFLARVDDPDRRVVVDPFHGGDALDEVALAELLRRAGSNPVRHVVARMLMNLRGIYASRGEYARLLVVLDRLIDVLPDASEELRDRGLLLGRLGAPEAAARDLDMYIERQPHASDIPEVRRWIERFRASSQKVRQN
jgi:regulator of sirC expression with transglutaminase-like and TPR domain